MLSLSAVPSSLQPPVLCILCPWTFPGKNTGVGCPLLLQGIFPTQGIKLVSLASLTMAGSFFTTAPPGKPLQWHKTHLKCLPQWLIHNNYSNWFSLSLSFFFFFLLLLLLKNSLEKEMATHSSVLAWRIPGMEEPGGLPSVGSHRVGHDWSDLAAAKNSLFTRSLKMLSKDQFLNIHKGPEIYVLLLKKI